MKKRGNTQTADGWLLSHYGIRVPAFSPPDLVARSLRSLSLLPTQLVRDCGVVHLLFEDMGISKEYSPNHGLYTKNTVTLNTQLVDDPLLFRDPENGRELNRFDHTLYHEFGHGWDMQRDELSTKPEWLSLSGWSKTPQPGKVKVLIKDKDENADIVGEWCYDPSAEFVRFYARTNPWDDFADTFTFIVAGLVGFVPPLKMKYFMDRMG